MNASTIRILSVLGATIVLGAPFVGCGGGSSSDVLGGSVSVNLSAHGIDGVERTEFAPGEYVLLWLTVRNDTEEPAYFSFLSGCQATASVVTPNGGEVWDFWRHAVCTDGLSGYVLDPGQVDVFDVVWQQVDDAGDPVPLGSYVARGAIPDNDRLADNVVELTIVDRAP